jgi:hypothetical protein
MPLASRAQRAPNGARLTASRAPLAAPPFKLARRGQESADEVEDTYPVRDDIPALLCRVGGVDETTPWDEHLLGAG